MFRDFGLCRVVGLDDSKIPKQRNGSHHTQPGRVRLLPNRIRNVGLFHSRYPLPVIGRDTYCVKQ